ncbi:hypothetical protein [Tistrella mobilis]
MRTVILIDTSVYLNILKVPGFDQQQQTVHADFRQYLSGNARFLLPMATIWETGNHIAHLGDGRLRRQHALRFIEDVRGALSGDAPYTATHFPERDEFLNWLTDFPDHAQRNKSDDRTSEGTSLADLSLIKEWQRLCTLDPRARVVIWSLDRDLLGYDRKPD